MTKKELSAICRQLARQLPGFVVKGQMIYISPINHTLLAIFFDSSMNPDIFYPHILIQPLFVPCNGIAFNAGWRMRGDNYTWNRDMPGLVDELLNAIREEALPFFEIAQIHGNVAALQHLGKSGDQIVRWFMAYSIVYDNMNDVGIEALDECIDFIKANYSLATLRIEQIEFVKALLCSAPPLVAQLFRLWEHESKQELALLEYV